MNPIDDQLGRLFRAARADPDAAIPPFGLETRAMAAWREGRTANPGLWDMTVLGRGLAIAIVLMALSFWPVINQTTDPFTAYIQVANSTLTSEVSP